MTYHEIIIAVLRDRARDHPEDPFLPAWALQGITTPYGWLGSSGSRRARELHERGRIQRELRTVLNGQACAFYASLEPLPREDAPRSPQTPRKEPAQGVLPLENAREPLRAHEIDRPISGYLPQGSGSKEPGFRSK